MWRPSLPIEVRLEKVVSHAPKGRKLKNHALVTTMKKKQYCQITNHQLYQMTKNSHHYLWRLVNGPRSLSELKQRGRTLKANLTQATNCSLTPLSQWFHHDRRKRRKISHHYSQQKMYRNQPPPGASQCHYSTYTAYASYLKRTWYCGCKHSHTDLPK